MSSYKLSFYVPESHLQAVKTAVFSAGAGRIGSYDSCCWQVAGQGQFRPLQGSRPFLGQQGQLESVAEYKLEMLCDEACIRQVLQALKAAHPYEEPAFDVIRVENFELP